VRRCLGLKCSKNTVSVRINGRNERDTFSFRGAVVNWRCVYFICVAWPACVALLMAAWKPTFKSVFLHAASKLSYATQWTHAVRLALNQKPKYTTRAHERQPTHRFYSLRALRFSAFFVCIHCVRCVRCVAYDSVETDL